uniref:NADH dehydrogenase subunit 5 n=1 Tax=Leocrates chinensis TaxID=378359 RepID=UPI0021D53950|nr:NADH dehydrogenase subunit 5 [Leocrates chinensis]UXC96463.1 NADH dehydrogenase subunit 5 [Leocrates chinensis]
MSKSFSPSSTVALMLIWSSLLSLLLPLALWSLMFTKTIIIEWSILTLASTEITIPIIIDPMGTLFSCAVLFITANVLQFGDFYMKEDPFIKRFIILIILFVLSMNFLIFIPHMMALLLGWDGLGVVSFILVIYYQNPKSLAAGMITALTNRIGDVMILLSIGWTLSSGHWNIMNMWLSPLSPMIIMSITLAAMTKSAQMPFSSWLPAAMAAPTPVSALVHSSTLVTAGVFLLIRFYPFLSSNGLFNWILLIIATSTMLMAGMSAMSECDLKKIIALSTLSQLGVMMSAIALGLPNLAFFHLITHALFKALLFICAGTLIHNHHHGQDLRTMGALMNQMPLTMSCLLTANLALCGFPFMAGFYSKDLIIELTLFNPTNSLIIFMFVLATILTCAYSVRLTLSALSSPHMSLPCQYLSDSDNNTTTPMILLSFGAISGGAAINWLMLAPSAEPVLTQSLKLSPLMMVISGAILGYMISLSPSALSLTSTAYCQTNSTMWFLVPLSSQNILRPPLFLSHKLLKVMDQGWVESSSAQGINLILSKMTSLTQQWQNTLITSHLSLILIFLSISLIY